MSYDGDHLLSNEEGAMKVVDIKFRKLPISYFSMMEMKNKFCQTLIGQGSGSKASIFLNFHEITKNAIENETLAIF